LTDAQKACQKMMQTEIRILQNQLSVVSDVEKRILQTNIDELTEIMKNIKHMPDNEAKALNNLIGT
jgi:hypothetical protein